MAYDDALAGRVRNIMLGEPGLSERRMFGGLAFMLDGHMCSGIVSNEPMLRLGADGAAEALERSHVRPMDFTGRPLKGMVYVAPEGLRGDGLAQWLRPAVAFVRTLPPKRKGY